MLIEKKVMTYSDPIVTYSHLKMTYSYPNVNYSGLKVTYTLGFVYRSEAVNGFGKPGKSAAAAAITLTTQGEMCI